MSRGTKRRSGADVSASGAAAPVPPDAEAAAPAPRKKRGPGRPVKKPKLAAKPKDDGEALIVAALTVERQKRELLLVAERAKVLADSDCGARDAAAALSVEARCRNKLIDLLQAADQADEIQTLRAEVAAMNARLAGKKGSAQRADVAPAPRVARRPESLQ